MRQLYALDLQWATRHGSAERKLAAPDCSLFHDMPCSGAKGELGTGEALLPVYRRWINCAGTVFIYTWCEAERVQERGTSQHEMRENGRQH